MNIQRKIQAFVYIIIGEMKRVLFGTKYYAIIDITNNCNLRCEHCYHFKRLSKGKNFTPIELPLDVWEKRFEDIHKKGIRFVTLCGGEPTLRLDIIELALKIFPIVYVITNGQIKIPKKFDRLVIFLSVDGDQKKNDAIRGEGTFEKLFKNYTGDRRAILNMTLLKNNYKDFESAVKLARQNNLRGVVCNFYINNPASPDPLFINEKERAIMIQELRRIKKKYPWNFLLTKSMIDWCAKSDHSNYCFWQDEALHFDNDWNRRRCGLGYGYCFNCGCFAGAMQSPLSLWRHIREAFMLS